MDLLILIRSQSFCYSIEKVSALTHFTRTEVNDLNIYVKDLAAGRLHPDRQTFFEDSYNLCLIFYRMTESLNMTGL